MVAFLWWTWQATSGVPTSPSPEEAEAEEKALTPPRRVFVLRVERLTKAFLLSKSAFEQCVVAIARQSNAGMNNFIVAAAAAAAEVEVEESTYPSAIAN